jgi:hypothetical protein
MKKCKGDYRGFTHSGESWYHDVLPFRGDIVDEVFFGLSCGGGGTHGEMKIEWITLSGKVVPRLQVFDDGWEVLNSFSDLLAEMAKVDTNNHSWKDKTITPKEFCAILIRCGFKDNTERENPNPLAPPKQEPRERALEKALANLRDAFMSHTRWSGVPPVEIIEADRALKVAKLP